MTNSSPNYDVYLEVGKKRAFAGAVEWPGWCRSWRDEESALQALLDHGPRYGRVLQAAGLEFQPPAGISAFNVVERLEGNASTDFGAPAVIPSSDARPLDEAGLRRLQALLAACWQAFEAASRAAVGKELRKGPRGGGRELEGIIQHVLGAEASYLSQLSWKLEKVVEEEQNEAMARTRQAAMNALAAAARGETPERGPRGGVRWTPRYYTRRAGWHLLDHTWELEDRLT